MPDWGGGVFIKIEFKDGEAYIEARGCVMADLERDMLIQDETALLLDIAASVESRGCCTYPSSFGVCDGGGCSATFRSGASTIISCR